MKKIFSILLVTLMIVSKAQAQPDLEEKIRVQPKAQFADLERKSRNNTPTFVASINPIYQILLAITGDKNNTILLFNPNKSEHDYELEKADIEVLNRAKAIFYVDDEFEKIFAKVVKNFSLQNKSYQVSKAPNLKLLNQRNNSGKIDFHLWLNPKNAVEIAEFMSIKLCALDAMNCGKYRNNYQKFSDEINGVVSDLNKKISSYRNLGFVFYHDGYQYFEDYFDLKSAMVLSYEGDAEIGVAALRKFDSFAKSKRLRCVFGEVLDESNTAVRLARKYQINYQPINSVGMNDDSYGSMLIGLVDEFDDCLFY